MLDDTDSSNKRGLDLELDADSMRSGVFKPRHKWLSSNIVCISYALPMLLLYGELRLERAVLVVFIVCGDFFTI